MDKEKIIDILKRNYGKTIGIGIGLIFAIVTISVGIIKTIFISICIYIGYFFGNKVDKKEDIIEILDKILPLGKLR